MRQGAGRGSMSWKWNLKKRIESVGHIRVTTLLATARISRRGLKGASAGVWPRGVETRWNLKKRIERLKVKPRNVDVVVEANLKKRIES